LATFLQEMIMPTDKRILELALKGLEAEAKRIDEEIVQVRQQLERAYHPGATAGKMAAPRRRRKMSAAARKLISQRMREVWAERRKAR
jgi:uncharacterized protein YdaU (DUF1376 family)